jgi:hypothetical protein
MLDRVARDGQITIGICSVRESCEQIKVVNRVVAHPMVHVCTLHERKISLQYVSSRSHVLLLGSRVWGDAFPGAMMQWMKMNSGGYWELVTIGTT